MIRLVTILKEVLEESRISDLKQSFVSKNILTPEEFDQIANTSLSKPAYTEWLFNCFIRDFIKQNKNITDFMEVKDEISQKLNFFERHKNLFQNKDITSYSLSDLNQAIDKINQEAGPATALSVDDLSKLKKVGVKNLGEIDGYQILVIPKGKTMPETFNAYRKLVCAGRTHVCTASNYNKYVYYTVNDNLFMIINPNDELSPYHVSFFNGSEVDKNDKKIEDPKILNIVKQLEQKYKK